MRGKEDHSRDSAHKTLREIRKAIPEQRRTILATPREVEPLLPPRKGGGYLFAAYIVLTHKKH